MASLFDSALGPALTQIAFYIPSELVVIVASLFLFNIRRRGAFSCLTFSLFLANTLASGYLPGWLGAAFGVLVLVVPQFAFSDDGFARKAFTAVVMQIAIVVAEVPPSLYWIGITDIPPTSPVATTEYLEFLLLARVIHVASLGLLLFGVYRAQRRITGYRTDRGALLFLWFFVLQYLMVALGVYTIELNQVFSKTAAVGLSVICVVCIIADVLCFVALDYYNRREREMWRTAFFQNELDGYLRAYEEIEHEVSLIAHVRHDLRNHMNVVAHLVAKGDLDPARDHVREMVEDLDRMAERPTAGRGSCDSFPEVGHADSFDELVAVQSLGKDNFSTERNGSSLDRESMSRAAARRLAVAVFPMSQIATIAFLLGYAAAAALPGWIYVAASLAAVLCFVADIILLHRINLSAKQGDVEAKARLLEEQALVQKRYYERLSMELEEALRSRQDLRLALLELEERLARGDSSEVTDILESLAMTPALKEGRYCQNRVVNALVSIKAGAILDEGIDFDCSISVPEDSVVSTVDLCALFSNLLDNALQACRRVEEGSRFIRLRSGQTAGVFAVTLENSCRFSAEEAGESPDADDAGQGLDAWNLVRIAGVKGSARSNRAQQKRVVGTIVREHGWGLRILNDMAKRYDGTFEASYEGEGRFRTAVMLVLDSVRD